MLLPARIATESQHVVRVLEGKRDEAWRAYDQASREIDRQRDDLLDEIGGRLEQASSTTRCLRCAGA